MKSWKVALKFEKKNEQIKRELELYDANRYFNGYLKIKRSYFNELVKTIKTTKKYIVGRGIEKVIGPDDKDWTFNPWMLLIVKDNERKKPFWFFIKREKDLSGLLVAIGPKLYATYNRSNAEARREIRRLINYIIAYLNKFSCVLILPNYLS